MSTLEPIAMPENLSKDMEHTADAPPKKRRKKKSAAGDAARAISSPWASLAAIVIAVLWTIPTIGLLVTSFRKQRAINTSGWWTSFSDPSAVHAGELPAGAGPGHLGEPEPVLHQHDRHHHPGGAAAAVPRLARGVRVRVDAVPGP